MDGMLPILGYSHDPASAPSAFYQSFLALYKYAFTPLSRAWSTWIVKINFRLVF